MLLTRLSKDDAQDVYDFEWKNRAYFEQFVPGRGDDYFNYDHFLRVLDELLAEQESGQSYFHIMKDKTGTIAGRMNIVDIDNGVGQIGYRVAEGFAGQGITSKALQQLLGLAKEQYGVTQLQAKTTVDNLGSQRVLEKNGFKMVDVVDENKVTFKHYAIQL